MRDEVGSIIHNAMFSIRIMQGFVTVDQPDFDTLISYFRHPNGPSRACCTHHGQNLPIGDETICINLLYNTLVYN